METLEAYGEEIEGDFAFYYSGQDADIRNLWKPASALTYRRAGILIERLPPESATKTAMRDALSDAEIAALAKDQTPEGHGPLTRSDLLLLDIFDQLRWLEYTVLSVLGAKPPVPKPSPRPGLVTEDDTTPKPLPAKNVAFLADMRARRGE